MTGSERPELAPLVRDLRAHRIGRREFMRRATALGLTAMGLSALLRLEGVAAQEASPAAASAGLEPGMRSISRVDARRAIRAAYPIEEAPGPGGQVIVPTSSDLQTLNGILVSDATSALAADQIFESLVASNPVDGSLVPGICDSFELAADGVTYTFRLVPDVTWHDGEPFTAEDVRFSFDSVLNEQVNSEYRASVVSVLDAYRVVDPLTFEMTAGDRFVTFLSDAPGTVRLIPRHLWENVPADRWPNDPGGTGEDPARVVGTGPFRFASRTLGDSVTLVRNDDYWDQPANLDEYVIRIVPDTDAEIQALRAGEIDIAETVSFSQVEDLRNTEGLRVETFPTGAFWYYIYNLDPAVTDLFQDRRVRQALFTAIDRQAIVDNITFGYAEVAQGTQPKLSIAYAPDRIETQYSYDPDRARQLLAEAGWEDADGDGIVERNGQPFRVEWLSVAGIGEYEQMLAAIQTWWRDVGVEMTPRFVDFPTLLDTQQSHQFQIMNLAFNWTPPHWDQGAMFRTDAYDGGFNYAKYSNPELDRLDDEQRLELDNERRVELLIEQANLVNEDLPVGILLFRDNRVAFSDRLRNYFPADPAGNHLWSLPWVWVED